jgi:hypothetical protein
LGSLDSIPLVDGFIGAWEKASTMTLSGLRMYLNVGEYSSKKFRQQTIHCEFRLW